MTRESHGNPFLQEDIMIMIYIYIYITSNKQLNSSHTNFSCLTSGMTLFVNTTNYKPIIIGALGTMTKGLIKGPEVLEIRTLVETIPTRV